MGMNTMIITELKSFVLAAGAAGAIALAAPVQAHDTPNLEHSHAFQQTAYGTYRQGHYVNGPQGSIIIWSPQPYTGYQNAPNVRFARPQAILKAPRNPIAKPRVGQAPTLEPGKHQKQE
jgi:hypothetical protein